MVDFYLDGQKLEMPEDTSIGLNVGLSYIEDPTSASASYTQTIKVPRTPHNAEVFGFTEQVLSDKIFNHEEHTMSIFEDGVELISGKAYLDSVNDDDYSVQVVGNEFDWLEAIRDKKLNEIDGTVISALKAYEALDSVQREAVFFALAEHGKWWQNVGDETIRRNWATYADLVPFVQTSTALQSIFKGYDINAGSIGYLLTQLYTTGQWSVPDNADVLAEDNTFKLSCASNNVNGVVYNGEEVAVVGGKIAVNSTLLQVDVFDTVDDDPNGVIVMEGGSGVVEGEEVPHYIPNFEPTEGLRCAFKIHLKYTTSTAYISPSVGYAFADTIHFGGNVVAKLSMSDGLSAIDGGAEALNAGTFDSAEVTPELPDVFSTNSIPEECKKWFRLNISDPTKYTEVVQIAWQGAKHFVQKIADVSSSLVIKAACRFEFADTNTIKSATNACIGLKTKYGEIVVIDGGERAYRKLQVGTSYVQRVDCAGVDEIKQATVQLYDIADSDNVTFDVNLLTVGNNIPSTGKGLSIGFASSKRLLLGNNELLVSVLEAEIEPVFNFAKMYNDPISLNDVGGDILATDYLKGIMQMFNLRIYANPDERTVYLLPHNEFYTNTVVDWSDRIDRDKGVEISTIGANIGKSFKLSYAEDNEVIADYNKRHKEPYLSWSTPLLDKQSAKDYELTNTALNAPMNIPAQRLFPMTEYHGKMLQLAGEDAQGTLDDFDLSSIPATVVLLQSATGAEGENIYNVGCAGVLADYLQPNFTAVDKVAGRSVSFADMDGVQGLHKHYDKQVEAWNYGKRITCYCRIYPHEIDSLRKAGTSPVDFRSRFLLDINGENIYCRLESIENYEPQNNTHKCSFLYME